MRVRLIVASLLAAGALLAGCQSTISGHPQGNAGSPTEPSFPTSQPTRSTPTPTALPPTPSATAAPPSNTVLPPENGYVFVETKSGQTRCQINASEVACEAQFANAPVVNGVPAYGVRVTAAGAMEFVVGNLGDIPVVTLDYQTYSAEGWTVVATEDGTRFTNDGTGHGMFVAIEGVEVF